MWPQTRLNRPPPCQHVVDMLTAMQRYPDQGGPEVMELDKYWHPHFSWYGPSGIGSWSRHFWLPPLASDTVSERYARRGHYPEDTTLHFFAEGIMWR